MLTHSPEGIPVLESRNIVRRRFVMTFGIAAIIALIAWLLMSEGANDRISGGGSTATQPLIQRMSVTFQDHRSGDKDWISSSAGIDYEPVGSLGGVMRLGQDPEIDFAITDYPLTHDTLGRMNAVQFPIAISSIAVAYNLGQNQKSTPPLRLSVSTLSRIFSGQIQTWADSAIAADNPGITLPATPIKLVTRADGSGSTLNLTRYLANGSADWNRRFGSNTSIKWPASIAVKGSSAMAEAIARQPGAIGYLETGQARRAAISIALLENAAGQYSPPDDANILAAARTLDLTDIGDNHAGGTTLPAANGYPIVAASYVIMKRKNAYTADNDRALRFFSFLLDEGREETRTLGYVPLSADIIAHVRQTWSHDLGFTSSRPTPTAAAPGQTDKTRLTMAAT
ncbi:MAG: phosphate ABC transporter substrate-binding protein PstS [Sphingobium sp.]|nr:phosphate ABC transporter substrate-binding protein PstS [Sphingobium sp.]